MKKSDLWQWLLQLLVSLAIVSMLVALFLPSREGWACQWEVDVSNLSSIARECFYYAIAHDDQFPPSLQVLTDEKALGPKKFIRPLDPKTLISRSRLDKNPGPEGSYIYLGAGIKNKDIGQDAERLIFAYGKPQLYRGEGVVVVYFDGHAEFVDMDRFEADLEYTKQWIEQYKATTQPAERPATQPE